MKYNINQKVIPISKSFFCHLDKSEQFFLAIQNNQQFLYITDYDEFNNSYECKFIPISINGDWFLESDLIPYNN